jgi:hypothetical protein
MYPDFQGGLVVMETSDQQNWTVTKLDGMTGQRYPAHSVAGPSAANDFMYWPFMAIHADGTIFTVKGSGPNMDSVVGINPTTGAEKFSVPLPAYTTSEWGVMIAGDGNAYVPYVSINPSGCFPPGWCNLHLGLLQVSSSGAYNNIPVYDWVGSDVEYYHPLGLITNADQGVLLSWDDYEAPNMNQPVKHMAIVTGGSVSLVKAPQIAGQFYAAQPVLQTQDGSFVGTTPFLGTMVAFDQAGNVRWAVPNEQPQIATENGGVIGQSGIFYDQNGSALGQLGNLPTYTWLGNSYRVGSVDQIFVNPIYIAATFCAFAGGNASQSGTANRPVFKDVQQLIAQIALKYADQHSQGWLDGLPPNGLNKCNIFVHDVLKEAGSNPPQSPSTSVRRIVGYLLGKVDTPRFPAQSRDWANPGTVLDCWRAVTVNPLPVGAVGPPLPPGTLPPDISISGDVIAEAINYGDAFGHVGFVVGTQQTASADSTAPCTIGLPAGTVDISDYGFRPSNWVDPIPCNPPRIYGKKKDTGVKRFVCQ